MTTKSLTTTKGHYALVALDQPQKIADGVGIDFSMPLNHPTLKQLSAELLKQLKASASGFVIDPHFTFAHLATELRALKLALNLEDSLQEVDPLSPPRLIENWGVEHVSNNYAIAKFGMYYHPQEPQALLKKQIVAELFDFCKHQETELLLQLMIYELPSEDNTSTPFQEAQVEAVQEFRSLCHVMALQYPEDPLTAVTITAELDIPWILDMQTTVYDQAKENLRLCLESGAKGFMVGQTLWKELATFRLPDQSPDWPAIEKYLGTQVRDRMIELTRISDEF